jgi:hypothetical protein
MKMFVFNATFNNISVISWRSVLLVEDLEKANDLSQDTDNLYHIMLYTLPWSRFKLTASVVIGTDCIGSCKKLPYDHCHDGPLKKWYQSVTKWNMVKNKSSLWLRHFSAIFPLSAYCQPYKTANLGWIIWKPKKNENIFLIKLDTHMYYWTSLKYVVKWGG